MSDEQFEKWCLDSAIPCIHKAWAERAWRAASGITQAPPKVIERCQGCGCNISERDCGCPAGTYKAVPEPKCDCGGGLLIALADHKTWCRLYQFKVSSVQPTGASSSRSQAAREIAEKK